MAVVQWTNKGYTHNLNTNSRAYELLQESKKNPEKLKELEKHLKQTAENEKALIKAAEKAMTPEALANWEEMNARQKAIFNGQGRGQTPCITHFDDAPFQQPLVRN